MWNKMNSTNQMRKTGFSIEVQQDYTRSTEVTALPPSFDWKLKLAHFYYRKYEMEKWEVTRSSNPLGSYI
jgi:hypothetical protein